MKKLVGIICALITGGLGMVVISGRQAAQTISLKYNSIPAYTIKLQSKTL